MSCGRRRQSTLNESPSCNQPHARKYKALHFSLSYGRRRSAACFLFPRERLHLSLPQSAIAVKCAARKYLLMPTADAGSVLGRTSRRISPFEWVAYALAAAFPLFQRRRHHYQVRRSRHLV
jgi:hypothetical protein